MKTKAMRKTLTIGVVATLMGLLGCKDKNQPAVSQAPLASDKAFVAHMQRTHKISTADAQAWLGDIMGSLDVIAVPRSNESVCAVIAVIEQESGYKEDPPVAGLAQLAEKKIMSAGDNLALRLALNLRLEQTMSSGKTFREGLKAIKTEKNLTDWYSEFTEAKLTSPVLGLLGKSVDDLVATVGSMQVSINYAREVAPRLGQSASNMRDTLYTRKGGVLFGTAHLLYYPANYNDMIYRFADFNAGHYASRNAGFQIMVGKLLNKPLVADGDLISHTQEGAGEASKTQIALEQLFAKHGVNVSPEQMAKDLAQEKSLDFERTASYQAVANLYQQKYKTVVANAVPSIRLVSEKITRKLTTEWYANSVNRRYQQCFAHVSKV